jgi:hypothetical protein
MSFEVKIQMQDATFKNALESTFVGKFPFAIHNFKGQV